MKLRNKKTGEIVFLENAMVKSSDQYFSGSIVLTLVNEKSLYNMEYSTLESVMEEWEDYEEPKGFWYIKPNGRIEQDNLGVVECDIPKEYYDKMVEIGNYFETKEEAEKVVEKLRAWKRLRDNGFEFTGWKRDDKHWGDFTITATDQTSCDDKDLDLLFGGEE